MSMTNMGKLISLILRHKPDVVGITLDEHGWANVDELIKGVNKKHKLTMEMLENIVATDEKQRYSFNEDKTKIRANQGHSINIDVELEEVEPPEILWHGTGEKYVESIRETGLVQVGKRHGNPVVFCVKSGQMYTDGYKFYKSKNGVWLTKSVPVEYLV